MNYEFEPFIRQGWQCPKCGRIYSPDQPMCFYCYGEKETYTTTVGTSLDTDWIKLQELMRKMNMNKTDNIREE